jgi:hypothetical protein
VSVNGQTICSEFTADAKAESTRDALTSDGGMPASSHDGAPRRSRFVTGATCLPGGYGYAVWSSRKAVTSDSRNLRWLLVSGLNRGRSTLSGRAVNG